MNGINLDVFEDTEADIDLHRCPANQVSVLLDLVRFDRFLDYVYATLLKRKPDREGQVHYRELVRKGMTRTAIVRCLLRSREFRVSSTEAVGLTVDEFVNRAYMDILGRWPDQNGLDTYRRMASKLKGRRRVLANLEASSEAVRRGGGRRARIKVLRSYAMTGWATRLLSVERWFASRRRLRQRLDRIALNQHLLAQQVASLREEVEAASWAGPQLFGFVDEAPVDGQMQSGGKAAAIFHNALTRARRET
jgi:hypothetical protein